MTLFVLPIAILVLLATLLLVVARSVVRSLRATLLVRHAAFHVTPHSVRPGSSIRVTAQVPARGRPVFVRGSLTCTMFDHRPRALYTNALPLAPVFGQPGEYAAVVKMPHYALRTGVVGDTLSNLFSEDAHRLLVFWSIDLEVGPADSPDVVLLRESIPVAVPDGQMLQPDRQYMDALIVQTCSAMHSDLIFNWLVRLAASDGVLDPRERQLLHDVLRTAEGVTDPHTADSRIALEMQRDLQIDPVLLRKHVPVEALATFYRFLYAMAWRDGQLDGREHNFLLDALEKFGLDAGDVGAMERDILHGFALHALR